MSASRQFHFKLNRMGKGYIIMFLLSGIVLGLGDECQYATWSEWEGWCPPYCNFAVQYRERSAVNSRVENKCIQQALTEERPCRHKCKGIKLITYEAESLGYEIGVNKEFEFENSLQSFGSFLNCDESCDSFFIQDQPNVCVSCLNKEDCVNMPQVSELVIAHFITLRNSSSEDIIQTPCNCFLQLRTIPRIGICDSGGQYKTYTLWN